VYEAACIAFAHAFDRHSACSTRIMVSLLSAALNIIVIELVTDALIDNLSTGFLSCFIIIEVRFLVTSTSFQYGCWNYMVSIEG
jgi:hypothetical protein